jgi:hypothetical protein
LITLYMRPKIAIAKKIFILLVLASFILMTVVPIHAIAQDVEKTGGNKALDVGSDSECGTFDFITYPCVMWGIFYLLDIGLRITGSLLSVIGDVFDLVLATQNQAFSDQPVVITGWKVTRDIVNIFYIFFLLIIAIATILGISSYNAKRLLLTLILSALLVNFSLPLTGILIDIANSLGNSFYLNIGETNVENDGERGYPVHRISPGLVKGFSPQKIYEPNALAIEANKSGVAATSGRMILAMIMGIILILVASFVLAAGAIMLTVRIIYLWLLLILSPFAFLFYVLPDTKRFASMWSKKLFEQAFFYPAYMFFIYLVFKSIDSGLITTMVRGKGIDVVSTLAKNSESGSGLTDDLTLILGFVFLGGLLIMSILAAKTLGAYGASAAQSYGKKGARAVQGYAGQRVRNAAIRGGGRFADSQLNNKARMEALGRVPVLRRAVRPLANIAEKREALSKKRVASTRTMSDPAALALLKTMSAFDQHKAFEGWNDAQRARRVSQMPTIKEKKEFADRIDSVDPSKDFKHKVAVASGNFADAMEIETGLRPPPRERMFRADKETLSDEGKEYMDSVKPFLKSMSDRDLARMSAGSINGNKALRMGLVLADRDIDKLAASRDATPETRASYEELSKQTKTVEGTIKIITDDIPRPDENATQAEKDKYQLLTNQVFADSNKEKMEDFGKELGENIYLQESFISYANPDDAARAGRTAEGVQGIIKMMERKAGFDNLPNDYTARHNAVNNYLTELKSANKRLGKFMESTAGIGLMSGQKSTKRSLATGDQSSNSDAPDDETPPTPTTPPPDPSSDPTS